MLAAGLSFSVDKISFEDVKKGLIATIDEALAGEKIVPVLNIDLEVEPEDVSISMIEELKQLEPFGASNPQPLFAINNFILKEKKLMGSNKEHLRLTVEKDNQKFNAIWWSKGDVPINNGDSLDIAFYPQLNTFNGNTSVQLIVKDIHSEGLEQDEQESGIKIYDHRQKTGIFKQVNDYLMTTKLNTIVFAEDKSVIDSLKMYPEISRRIKNRNTLEKCDALMFFDYPANNELLELILTQTTPSIIHYMNYSVKHSVDEYFKTISGMAKFVCNNKQGVFNLLDSSVFLGVTKDLIELSLIVLKEAGVIQILEQQETCYKIANFSHVNGVNFKNLPIYSDFEAEYLAIEGFKTSLKTVDLDSISVCMV